jgi:hypothetical protein
MPNHDPFQPLHPHTHTHTLTCTNNPLQQSYTNEPSERELLEAARQYSTTLLAREIEAPPADAGGSYLRGVSDLAASAVRPMPEFVDIACKVRVVWFLCFSGLGALSGVSGVQGLDLAA